jgi:hypothetical protein
MAYERELSSLAFDRKRYSPTLSSHHPNKVHPTWVCTCWLGRIFVVNTKVHVHMAKRTSSWSSPPAFLMPAFTSVLGRREHFNLTVSSRSFDAFMRCMLIISYVVDGIPACICDNV